MYTGTTLNGGAGNDTVIGTAAPDLILGGKGNDTLTGGWNLFIAGGNTFKWESGDGGSVTNGTADGTTRATDVITDFQTASGYRDVLDVKDLLPSSASSNLEKYFHFAYSDNTTSIYLNSAGFSSGDYTKIGDANQIIQLTGVDLITLSGGGTDSAIATYLINHGMLVV